MNENNLTEPEDQLQEQQEHTKPAATAAGFQHFELNKQLMLGIAEAGYTTPTPVQEKAIPLALAGHDVLGIAQTGTGKTAAYGLPILMKTKYAQGHFPRALIMAPTRELAIQIEQVLQQLASHTDLRIFAVYGGLGPKTQIETIKKGIDILVATPGRMLDLYLAGHLILKDLKTLVLDEADKMMDMGFMPQLRRVLEIIPRKRQNLLFSATMPPKVIELSHEFLEFPETVEVAPTATPLDNVSQVLYRLPNLHTKINMLNHLFKDLEQFGRVMIFARTKATADNIAHFLNRKVEGEVRLIHGNKGQNARMNSIDSFREGDVRFLVATDVASRGIDVQNVSHVINFDVPIIYEDYVHRIGRTGRAGALGVSITFATDSEMYHVRKIEKLIKMKIPEEQVPAQVKIEATPFEEQQYMALEIDRQKRRENPDFQGAFHEKTGKGAKHTKFQSKGQTKGKATGKTKAGRNASAKRGGGKRR